MADIAWSAYALAMFTPEQRAAAIAGGSTFVPDEQDEVLPPVTNTLTTNGLQVIGGRSTSQLMAETGLNPNNPADAAVLGEQGWTYVGGQWIKQGGASTSGGAGSAGTYHAGSASFATSASQSSSGTVLGYIVPAAAPVLLPSFVGGRIGVVRRSGGLRPASGGRPRIIKTNGPQYAWNRVVLPNGGGGGDTNLAP